MLFSNFKTALFLLEKNAQMFLMFLVLLFCTTAEKSKPSSLDQVNCFMKHISEKALQQVSGGDPVYLKRVVFLLDDKSFDQFQPDGETTSTKITPFSYVFICTYVWNMLR